MKCEIKLYLIIVFLAISVNLRDSNIKIYKHQFKDLEIWNNELNTILDLINDRNLEKGTQEWNNKASVLDELLTFFSKKSAFWPPKVVEYNGEKYKICPDDKASKHYDFDENDYDIMYECFLSNFQGQEDENKIKCLLKHLGFKFGKISYSNKVAKSEIESEIELKPLFLNTEIKFIVIFDKKPSDFYLSLVEMIFYTPSPETYVIMHDELEELTKCTICDAIIEREETSKKIPCKHIFHDHCIIAWSHSEKNCPVCKLKIHPKMKKIHYH